MRIVHYYELNMSKRVTQHIFQKMAPKGGINVRELSLDTELEFTVLEKTTGGSELC